jgi:hypothetical protein
MSHFWGGPIRPSGILKIPAFTPRLPRVLSVTPDISKTVIGKVAAPHDDALPRTLRGKVELFGPAKE